MKPSVGADQIKGLYRLLCSHLGTVEGVVEPGMSSTTARNMAILQHIPFVVSFKDRVKVSS